MDFIKEIWNSLGKAGPILALVLAGVIGLFVIVLMVQLAVYMKYILIVLAAILGIGALVYLGLFIREKIKLGQK